MNGRMSAWGSEERVKTTVLNLLFRGGGEGGEAGRRKERQTAVVADITLPPSIVKLSTGRAGWWNKWVSSASAPGEANWRISRVPKRLLWRWRRLEQALASCRAGRHAGRRVPQHPPPCVASTHSRGAGQVRRGPGPPRHATPRHRGAPLEGGAEGSAHHLPPHPLITGSPEGALSWSLAPFGGKGWISPALPPLWDCSTTLLAVFKFK